MLDELKKEVYAANLDLVKTGLVIQTWGNVSGINRAEGLIVIKPSGVRYDEMTIDDMVVVDLDGKIAGGNKRPSSDTATHIELYKAFPEIGGITHTHSTYATIFSQACKEITCFGTTHADHFAGSVPLTRFLTKEEIEFDYEKNTGIVIVERFRELNPVQTPGVLVAGHAPFTWGKNASDALNNSEILERVAMMAFYSLQLNPGLAELPEYISQKHFNRKHGPNAYYGQKLNKEN
jgi:L-ribulose-5-phosphate 4-epimerase